LTQFNRYEKLKMFYRQTLVRLSNIVKIAGLKSKRNQPACDSTLKNMACSSGLKANRKQLFFEKVQYGYDASAVP